MIAASIEIARPSLHALSLGAGVPPCHFIAPGNITAFPVLIAALFPADPLPTIPQATHTSSTKSSTKKDYLQSSKDAPEKKSLPPAVFVPAAINTTAVPNGQESPALLSQATAPLIKLPKDLSGLTAHVSSVSAATETTIRQLPGPIAFTLRLTPTQERPVREVAQAQPAPRQPSAIEQAPMQPAPIEQAQPQSAPTTPAPPQPASTQPVPEPTPTQQSLPSPVKAPVPIQLTRAETPSQPQTPKAPDQPAPPTQSSKPTNVPEDPQRFEVQRPVVTAPQVPATPASPTILPTSADEIAVAPPPEPPEPQAPAAPALPENIAPPQPVAARSEDRPAASEQVAIATKSDPPKNDTRTSTPAPPHQKTERRIAPPQGGNDQPGTKDAKPQSGRKDASPQTDTKQTRPAPANAPGAAFAENSAGTFAEKAVAVPASTQPKAAQPHTATAAAETPKYPAASLQPARQISLQLKSENAARVDVQLTDRAGRIAVAVRTADRELAKSLQTNLSDLVGRLDNKGFKTEAWIPSAARTGEAASFMPAKSDNSREHSGGSGGWKDPDQQNQSGSNPRQQPRWIAERKKAFDETGDNNQ